jgi:hypothetical protein
VAYRLRPPGYSAIPGGDAFLVARSRITARLTRRHFQERASPMVREMVRDRAMPGLPPGRVEIAEILRIAFDAIQDLTAGVALGVR